MSIDASENETTNPTSIFRERHLSTLIDQRLSRRGFIGGLGGFTALATTGCLSSKDVSSKTETSQSNFSFAEISRGIDETHHLPDNHSADILLRWGDALFPDSPSFDAYDQTPEKQRRQFGYNNDFIGFIPLSGKRGLLCVNHEYTTTKLMFPNFSEATSNMLRKNFCGVELAAHGGTIVEIEKDNGRWMPVITSQFNRRITADTTPMQITGPAAGHERLKTSADPTGTIVAGTMNNCAGGITPWGTYLMAEENFNGCFMGKLPSEHPEAINHARYGVPGGWYEWGRFIDRFDVDKEPHEPNRFGWIVEVDPMDPTSTPKKRTALGRFKHEGAESVVSPDGRLVVYMGDDQRFDYLYKFVSRDKVNLSDKKANQNLLDSGILYVARFEASGDINWMPLKHGIGPLTSENNFYSQADVMIETRRAADLLEATPMDRPEDVEPDEKTGRVWVMLTNNDKRADDQTNAANPRPENLFGHIIEIIEPDGNFAATTSRWEILVKCGDPDVAEVGATWNPLTSDNGWFGSPDNCAVDSSGRLWIATDGNPKTGAADGLWALETEGELRGTSRAFFRAPIGAEVCGPRFTPDGKTLFIAVQHPGDGRGATFEAPTTQWPDFDEKTPPRPSVIAIRHNSNGLVGT